MFIQRLPTGKCWSWDSTVSLSVHRVSVAASPFPSFSSSFFLITLQAFLKLTESIQEKVLGTTRMSVT